MKIQLDWLIDSIEQTRAIIEQHDFLSVSIDVVDAQIILEGSQNTLRNFVFGKYTALLQSNSDWANTYGISTSEDFCDLIVKN